MDLPDSAENRQYRLPMSAVYVNGFQVSVSNLISI